MTTPTPAPREARETGQRAPDHLCCTKVKIGNSVGFINHGGPVYTIRGDSGKAFTFEWHPYFGPSRCSSTTGDILGNGLFPERSKFWPLFEAWMANGKRVDEHNRCILPAALSAPATGQT